MQMFLNQFGSVEKSTMTYKVLFTDDAVCDLEEIDDYISVHDSVEKADYVLSQIETLANSLSTSPQRGSCPEELLVLGMKEYREVYFKPYRIIYRITAKVVTIYVVVDGRRDMQTLLNRRLLSA